METGVFRCDECSTYFPETVPPFWLDYWPEHCGKPAPLQHVLGSVAVELRVAEVMMAGGAPAAVLDPLPTGVLEEEPVRVFRHPPPRSQSPLGTYVLAVSIKATLFALPIPMFAVLGL